MAERVTLISQFFYPETGAVPQLLTELAIGLQRRGLEVLVYTAQPSCYRPDRRPKPELLDRITIRRLFGTQFSKYSLGGRLLNGITFSGSVALRLLCGSNPGVVVATTNPPFLPWAAWLVSLLRWYKYVVLVHDLYPDVAIRLGYMKQTGLVARAWRRLNQWAFSRASAVIVLGASMKDEANKYLLDGAPKVHVIHSWADGDMIVPRPKAENWFADKQGLADKFVVLYSGNIGMAHDFETLIEAADRLRSAPNIVFLFIGEGGKKERLMAAAAERGLGNVRFLPHMPYDQLPYSLTAGDVGVVTLEKGVEGLCEPSKLYAYLAAGLAILGLVGERSEVAKIIRRHDCGCRVDQGDVEGVVQALKHWSTNPTELERMKRNARQCFERYYDKDRAIDKYFRILANI